MFLVFGLCDGRFPEIRLLYMTVELTSLQVFFPAEPKPTAPNMNWSCLIFGVVIFGAWIYYAVKKRHEYRGPVELVRKEEDIDMADFPPKM